MSKPGTLILARHGESTMNASGVWTGHLDPPLSPKGEVQARALATLLAEQPIHHAYTSDLQRSKTTWEIAAQQRSSTIPITVAPALRERDYGTYAGKNKWHVRDEIGTEAFTHLRRSWDAPIPQGESLKDVYNRVVPYYQHEIAPRLASGETVVAVTHGNTNRALIKYLESIADDAIAELEMPHNTVIVYTIDHGTIIRKEEHHLPC